MPRQIVIDADIAMGAGRTDDPRSERFRAFLLCIEAIGHFLVLTPQLEREWAEHAVPIAKSVFSALTRRSRIVRVEPDSRLEFILPLLPDDATQMVTKDIHLVDAALETEKRIASGDLVRGHFARASASLAWLREILWVNPAIDDDAIDWLRNNAPDSYARFRLGPV